MPENRHRKGNSQPAGKSLPGRCLPVGIRLTAAGDRRWQNVLTFQDDAGNPVGVALDAGFGDEIAVEVTLGIEPELKIVLLSKLPDIADGFVARDEEFIRAGM